MKTIWFTADTHFGHAAIMRHQERPGDTVAEMDAALIDAINHHVKRNDTLWHLGDFCWRASRAGHYRARLNVRELHVVRGNHEAGSLARVVSSCQLMAFKRFGATYFHLSHYPLYCWRRMHCGGWHLYGHSHGSVEIELEDLFPGRRAMDVGVDNAYRLHGEWRPFSLAEILARPRESQCEWSTRILDDMTDSISYSLSDDRPGRIGN